MQRADPAVVLAGARERELDEGEQGQQERSQQPDPLRPPGEADDEEQEREQDEYEPEGAVRVPAVLILEVRCATTELLAERACAGEEELDDHADDEDRYQPAVGGTGDSDALKISRGTLREAMRQLQQEGLISATGDRGRLLVRHLDAKEIRDIFQVRAALEALGARELCALPDRADAVATLHRAVEEMERWAASNLEDRIEADLRFHRTMCQLTGNETLLHQWTSLEGSIRMSIMYAGVDRAIKNMDAKRHHDIVDAIETGDADTAETAVRDHMAAAAVPVEGAA